MPEPRGSSPEGQAAGTLVSVNVGLPQDVAWQGRTVHTGVWKREVTGPQMVRRLNIDGDGQGDLGGHGGEQRAVLAYQLDSYRHWQQVFGLGELEHGAFGENFTVDGLGDDEVCIGDRYRIGEAELEVTQPRVTCFRVAMRMGQPRLPSLLVAHHRPGFYLRVITEGRVSAGDAIVRTRRGPHALTVADVDALLYLPGHDPARLVAALDVPALSPGWQGSFREMLEAGPGSARPAGVGTAPAPSWSGFRTLTVVRAVPESATVTSFWLTGDAPLPAYEAGQYLTLRVRGAADPAPVRTYSLSTEPQDGRYRISVKCEPHGLVSTHLHAHLQAGDQLEAAAPRGEFVLDAGTGPVLLVSAGIGVTPVLAMLHRLVRERSAREVWWIHSAHDEAGDAFATEVADLLAELAHARSFVWYTATAGTPGPRPGVRTGRLTPAALAELGLPPDASAYVCGPEGFMDAVTAALVGAGLDPARVRTERFASRSAFNPGVLAADVPPPHQPPGDAGTGPGVTFARSGLSTTWSEAYASVLELAEACDVPTRWSCRTGVCHTCVTSVLSGTASYSTPPLEPPGPDELLICSVRPSTDLVLDL